MSDFINSLELFRTRGQPSQTRCVVEVIMAGKIPHVKVEM